MSFFQTYKRQHDGRRSWVLLPTGHQAERPTHNRTATLIVDDVPEGSNHLIDPHRLTLTIRAGSSITLSVEQMRALLDDALTGDTEEATRPATRDPSAVFNPDGDTGLVHAGCSYMAHGNTICTKCGQLVIPGPWPNVAMPDPQPETT